MRLIVCPSLSFHSTWHHEQTQLHPCPYLFLCCHGQWELLWPGHHGMLWHDEHHLWQIWVCRPWWRGRLSWLSAILGITISSSTGIKIHFLTKGITNRKMLMVQQILGNHCWRCWWLSLGNRWRSWLWWLQRCLMVQDRRPWTWILRPNDCWWWPSDKVILWLRYLRWLHEYRVQHAIRLPWSLNKSLKYRRISFT